MLAIITLRSIRVLTVWVLSISTRYQVLSAKYKVLLVTLTENLEQIFIRLVFYVTRYTRSERKLRIYNEAIRK